MNSIRYEDARQRKMFIDWVSQDYWRGA